MVTPVEVLNSNEIQPIFLQNFRVLDLPYLPVLWAAFDPNLYQQNGTRLMKFVESGVLPDDQAQAVRQILARADEYSIPLQSTREWTEVRRSIAARLGISTPDFARVPSTETLDIVSDQLQRAHGNVVMMGTPHSLLVPVHAAIHAQTRNPFMRVGEIVFDRHIDTKQIVLTTDNTHPGRLVQTPTSANVYRYLQQTQFLQGFTVIGPTQKALEVLQSRGAHQGLQFSVVDVSDIGYEYDEKTIGQVLSQFKKWGITHVTLCVDLDGISEKDGVVAVRYSPILPLIGLGCQRLPNKLTKNDLGSLRYLQYPAPAVSRLLRDPEKLHQYQDPVTVRQMLKNIQGKVRPVKGPLSFNLKTMETDITPHLVEEPGVRLERVLKMIALIKALLPEYRLKDGITLTNGARYKGSVVEMCGFEGPDKRTTQAAVECVNAIGA